MPYAVVTYANMRGVRAVDRIVDLCGRNLAFIMLTKGRHPKRDTFYDFKGEKLKGEVLDELNHQFMRRLEKKGLVTLKQLYVDGTKIEANANPYTFVWRGTLNYHLAGLLDTIDALYERYNPLLSEHGYGAKYNLGNARMFIIEDMDKVRNVIEENRKRKLTKHKKISNNTVIEIDNCSPLEILKLQQNLLRVAAGEGITFVNGKGQKRPEIQLLHEELEKCGSRLMKYERGNYRHWLLQREESAVSEGKRGCQPYKLQNHEQRKTRAYREDIGKHYNMKREVSEDGHYYICHDG